MKEEQFRTDAKAEGRLGVIGRWELVQDRTDVPASRGFSLTLDEETAPWAYARGQPYRTIAALELYATLISVMVFTDESSGDADVSLSLSGSKTTWGTSSRSRR